MRRASVRPLLVAWVLVPSLVCLLSGCRSGGGLTGWSAPSWMSWNNWGWGNRTASSLAHNKPSTTVPKPSTTTPPQPLSSVAAGTGSHTQGGYAPNPQYTTVTGTYPPGTSPAVAAAGLGSMATAPQPGTPPATGYQTGPYSTTTQPPASPYPTAGFSTAGYAAAGSPGYPTATPSTATATHPAAYPQTQGYPAATVNAYAATAGSPNYGPTGSHSPGQPAGSSYPSAYPTTGYPSSGGYATSSTYPTTGSSASAASAYGQPAYPTTAPAQGGGYAAAHSSPYGGSAYGPTSGPVAVGSATGSAAGTAPAAYHTPAAPQTPSAATGVWSGYSQPANAPYDQRSSTSPTPSNGWSPSAADTPAVASQTNESAGGRRSSIYGGPVTGEAEPAAAAAIASESASPSGTGSGGVAVASYPPVPSSLAPEAGGFRPGSTATSYGVQNAGYQQPAATAAAPGTGGSVYGGSVTR